MENGVCLPGEVGNIAGLVVEQTPSEACVSDQPSVDVHRSFAGD